MSNLDEILDGDASREAELTPAERARLADVRAAIDAVVAGLRSEPAPDLTGTVMERIRSAAPVDGRNDAAGITGVRWVTSIPRSLGWLWTPRPVTLRFRPAYALAALGLVLALALARPSLQANAPIANGADAPAVVYVQFRLDAPDAQTVALAGTFTGWEARHPLVQTSPGIWTVVIPLRPGVHDYAFVLDGGMWVTDPNAPTIADGFGGTNSRLSIVDPSGARS